MCVSSMQKSITLTSSYSSFMFMQMFLVSESGVESFPSEKCLEGFLDPTLRKLQLLVRNKII